jgi:copper chaperone CopZ
LNLSKLPGVEKCNVSYEQGKATLVYADGAKPDLEAVNAIITKLGYTSGAATVRSTN